MECRALHVGGAVWMGTASIATDPAQTELPSLQFGKPVPEPHQRRLGFPNLSQPVGGQAKESLGSSAACRGGHTEFRYHQALVLQSRQRGVNAAERHILAAARLDLLCNGDTGGVAAPQPRLELPAIDHESGACGDLVVELHGQLVGFVRLPIDARASRAARRSVYPFNQRTANAFASYR